MSKLTPSAQEQLVSQLRSANNRLEYLSQNDWVLITDRAKHRLFHRGEKLVEQGKPSSVVYLLASGMVKIQAGGVTVAHIGPGEVCGEMAFLEGTVPSATATAREAVEAYGLEWSELEKLFELYPHLASRFYRSLAVSLSRRLRQQIGSSGAATGATK